MLRITRRTARPIAGAGPDAPPKQPVSNGIDNSWRAGPFTNTPGTTHDVVVFSAKRLNAGSAMASIAAHNSGIDAAGAPAMTAFTATFSTVQRPLRGGSSARHSSGKRPDATRCARTRSSVGGTSGSPSPHPASVASFWNASGSSSTSRRALDSQSSSQPSGPQSTRPAISLCSWFMALRPYAQRLEQAGPVVARDLAYLGLGARLERVRQHVDAQARPPGVGGHGVGEMLELCGYDDDRRLPLGGHGDGVVHAPRGAGASVAEADDGDVDVGREVFELGEGANAGVADAVARAPRTHVCAGGDQLACPLVEHPLERRPRAVGTESDRAAGELAGVGPRVGIDLRRRCSRVEDRDSCHCPTSSRCTDGRRVP